MVSTLATGNNLAADAERAYTLLDPAGKPYQSENPGAFGGHRCGKRYGRLDCRAALRAIARGGYVQHRVFFASEDDARAAGYRPCAVCMPDQYAAWKAARAGRRSVSEGRSAP